VRVIAGSAKGTPLYAPKGAKTRPIPDRVKESLLNILSESIQHSHVLELYAGTGALGIEALSRGALSCVFVENDRVAIDTIKKNLNVTGFQANSQVIKHDVLKIVARLEKHFIDIVFACPPYPLVGESVYRNKLLVLFSDLYAKDIVLAEGIMVLQHREMIIGIPHEAPLLELSDTRTYGDTQLSFFKRKRSL